MLYYNYQHLYIQLELTNFVCTFAIDNVLYTIAVNNFLYALKQLQNILCCGWRSVRQERYYHTLLLVHKIILQKAPQYLYSRLTADGSYNYMTRSSSTSSIRRCKSFNTSLALCKDSFKWRGVDWYEALPLCLRSVHNVATFKLNLNSWIKINIPI